MCFFAIAAKINKNKKIHNDVFSFQHFHLKQKEKDDTRQNFGRVS